MSNQMSMDEMIEVLARYRYNAKHDADRIKALETTASELRSDVERLRQRYEDATTEISRLRASSFVTAVPVEQYEKLKAEVERLKAEPERLLYLFNQANLKNDRLRKAGDALVFALESMDIIMDTNSDHPEVAEWNAAKEGKQS